MMSAKDLVVFKPESTLITESGMYILQVTKHAWINSHTLNFDGEIKAGVHEAIENGDLWETPGEELAVTLALAGKDQSGVITVRHHFQGFLKPSDKEYDDYIDREDVKVIEWKGTEYVCQKNENGNWDRIPHPDKTKKALNKTMQFLSALNVKPGRVLKDAIESAQENGYLVKAKVEVEKYGGKEIPKVTQWYKVTEEDLADMEEDTVASLEQDDLKM